MREMGIKPVYPQTELVEGLQGRAKVPLSSEEQLIRQPNQTWSTNITYAPMGRTHMHLITVIDWPGRYVSLGGGSPTTWAS